MQQSPIPAQAPDYIRTDDGATMRETAPDEFVNLAILQGWGFKVPTATQHARAATPIERL